MRPTPQRVHINEVGPRDGLQNEKTALSLTQKKALIEALISAGVRRIEVGSFVRGDRVPQMSDTDQLCQSLPHVKDVDYVALVPNMKGLERAISAKVKHIGIFTAASEAFAQANGGANIADTMKRLREVTAAATAQGIAVRGDISTCWWCPYEGKVDGARVLALAQELIDMGCTGVALADTIGAATPSDVSHLFEEVLAVIPADQLTAHFHDTRGTGLANILASFAIGITSFDTSAGGTGGCPFAPGAQGNVATEDVLYMMHGMGIETGIDLNGVRAASLELEKILGHALPSRVLRAGMPKTN